MTVELDRRPGDDVPRVTIKRFQPLDDLAKRARLQLTLHLPDAAHATLAANELASHRGGNGLVRAIVDISGGRTAELILGRDFALDADTADRMARLLGAQAVELSAQESPRLALVG